jgi:hypothetical protein
VYARPPTRRSCCPCSLHKPLSTMPVLYLPCTVPQTRPGAVAAQAHASASLHRSLGDNRFSGTVPSTISALTALTSLCAPHALPESRGCGVWASRRDRLTPLEPCVACGRMLHCAWSGTWPRTALPARSSRASRRSPGWSPCALRHRPCGLPADSGLRTGTLWRRNLVKNRFSGRVPPTISALTALTFMCAADPGRAPADAVHASMRERVAARRELVRCGRMLHRA